MKRRNPKRKWMSKNAASIHEFKVLLKSLDKKLIRSTFFKLLELKVILNDSFSHKNKERKSESFSNEERQEDHMI